MGRLSSQSSKLETTLPIMSYLWTLTMDGTAIGTYISVKHRKLSQCHWLMTLCTRLTRPFRVSRLSTTDSGVVISNPIATANYQWHRLYVCSQQQHTQRYSWITCRLVFAILPSSLNASLSKYLIKTAPPTDQNRVYIHIITNTQCCLEQTILEPSRLMTDQCLLDWNCFWMLLGLCHYVCGCLAGLSLRYIHVC